MPPKSSGGRWPERALLFAALFLALASPAAAAPEPLHARVLAVSLPALAAGLREPELAREALAWTRAADPALLAISLEPGREALVAPSAASLDAPVATLPHLPLERCFAQDLALLSRYHMAVDASDVGPVPPDAIETAFRDPATAARLRAVFARAWSGPRVADRASGGQIPFEPGGVAWLDGGRLVLVEVRDPVHALARALLDAASRPAEIPAILAQRPLFAFAIDANGLLAAFLERHPPPQTTGPWDERERKGLDLVLTALAANAADSYGIDDEGVGEALLEARPDFASASTRWVGLWHGHPGRPAGDVPSEDDRRVALTSGRFLTIVEQPDGFVVHDLRRGEVHPRPLRVR